MAVPVPIEILQVLFAVNLSIVLLAMAQKWRLRFFILFLNGGVSIVLALRLLGVIA